MSSRRKLLWSLPIALLTLELFARAATWGSGDAYDSHRWTRYIEQTLRTMQPRDVEGASSANVPHPYYGWDQAHAVDLLGQKIPTYTSAAADERFDVLLIGSSVGAGVGNHAGEHLLALLRDDPLFAGRELKLHNHARASFKQPQQTMLFVELLSHGMQPDAVICIDGFNEVALGLLNHAKNTHPLYPGIMQWGPLVRREGLDPEAEALLAQFHGVRESAIDIGRTAVDNGLVFSCLLGRLALYRVKSQHARWLAMQQRYLDLVLLEGGRDVTSGPMFEGDRDDAIALTVEAWERGTLMLDALCRSMSIPFVHMLQPNTNDPGSKPLSAEELTYTATADWVEAGQKGYPLLRAACVRLAAAGVRSVDGSRLFADIEETLYTDNAHLNQRGRELLAERVGQELLALLHGR